MGPRGSGGSPPEIDGEARTGTGKGCRDGFVGQD